MSDLVFARIDDELHPLDETPFAVERDIQRLVGAHPELLAGAQMDPGSPRRFVLVAEEVPVPDEAEGSGRWALDHLFIDQDAIPTLVEVKRAANSQLRREVVGQLLDYAANAVRYWRAEDLSTAFIATHGDQAHSVLSELAGSEAADNAFWHKAMANLAEGRVRLLFLADRIPTELQAIVEFLNERIEPTEVLAVELRQYRTPDGPQVLVPRVIGITAVAKSAKNVTVPYEDLLAEATPETRDVERSLLDWAKRTGVRTALTATGRKFASPEGVTLFYFFPRWGSIDFPMEPIRDSNDELADQLHQAMMSVSSKRLTEKNPSLSTKDVAAAWDKFERDVLNPHKDALLAAHRQPRQ